MEKLIGVSAIGLALIALVNVASLVLGPAPSLADGGGGALIVCCPGGVQCLSGCCSGVGAWYCWARCLDCGCVWRDHVGDFQDYCPGGWQN